LCQDFVEATGDSNLYRYVKNGPLKSVDPSGFELQITVTGTVGIFNLFAPFAPPALPIDISAVTPIPHFKLEIKIGKLKYVPQLLSFNQDSSKGPPQFYSIQDINASVQGGWVTEEAGSYYLTPEQEKKILKQIDSKNGGAISTYNITITIVNAPPGTKVKKDPIFTQVGIPGQIPVYYYDQTGLVNLSNSWKVSVPLTFKVDINVFSPC
jgi:hypothetical protein